MNCNKKIWAFRGIVFLVMLFCYVAYDAYLKAPAFAPADSVPDTKG